MKNKQYVFFMSNYSQAICVTATSRRKAKQKVREILGISKLPARTKITEVGQED